MKPHFRKMALVLLAIVMFAVAPVLSVMASIGIASAYDCKVNEAATYPCMIGGMDVGELLATMFVAGWFGLATIPMGAVALLIWIATAVVLFARSRQPAT